MLPLPLFHVYANVGVQALALITGNPMALVPNPRDIAGRARDDPRVKPAFFNGVPTLYIALLNHPDVQRGKVDFKSIKICFSGAAALMADTKQRFEAMTGGRIVEGYSLTEAMMALCVNPVKGPNKIGSVGHAAARRARRGSSTATRDCARCRPAKSARSALPRRS